MRIKLFHETFYTSWLKGRMCIRNGLCRFLPCAKFYICTLASEFVPTDRYYTLYAISGANFLSISENFFHTRCPRILFECKFPKKVVTQFKSLKASFHRFSLRPS